MTSNLEATKSRLFEKLEDTSLQAKEGCIPVAAVKPVLRYVFFHRPFQFEAFLSKWELPREIISLGDLQVPHEAMTDLWRVMDEVAMRNPIAGFEAAHTFDYADMGLLGLLFSSAETPRELMELQDKYFSKYFGKTGVWWREAKNAVEVFWAQEGQAHLSPVISNYVMGAVFCGYRGLANCDTLLLEVHFPYSKPSNETLLTYIEDYFTGADLHFSKKEAKLVFDPRFMDLKLRTFDPELRVVLERKIIGTGKSDIPSDPKDIFLSRVRALIRSNLANRELSSKWVARQLRFSRELSTDIWQDREQPTRLCAKKYS